MLIARKFDMPRDATVLDVIDARLPSRSMATADIALAELAEKGADVDVLRQMMQNMAQRLMELDVEGRCCVG